MLYIVHQDDVYKPSFVKACLICNERNLIGECWLPAFSSFPTMFSKAFDSSASKVVIVW